VPALPIGAALDLISRGLSPTPLLRLHRAAASGRTVSEITERIDEGMLGLNKIEPAFSNANAKKRRNLVVG
jgi:hypothetical protein